MVKWGLLLERRLCFHPGASAESCVALAEVRNLSGLQQLPLILEGLIRSKGRRFTLLADLLRFLTSLSRGLWG